MDYFIRYEDLENGIKHVCDHLDLPFEPDKIPNIKSGYRKNFSIKDFYDEKTIETVRSIYAFELQKFDYSIPDD